MKTKTITTDREYETALARIEKLMALNVVRAYQEGKIGKGKMITDAQMAEWLGLTRKELRALDNLRATPPGSGGKGI